MKARAAVLISGRGSNMMSLIRAARDPAYPVEIALVVSNQPQAPGVVLARAEGVPAVAIDHRPFQKDRAAHEAAIDAALGNAGIEIVCLAGYMRLFTPYFIDRWADRAINIHPSLLPAFPGLHTHEQALATGVKLHGCTVHAVRHAMDTGPILAQAAVPVLPGDTPDSLAARVLAQEHVIYPLALRLFAEQRQGMAPAGDKALLNPLPEAAPVP